MRRPAIFMDRDGTICEEVGYVNHLSRSRLLPHSLEAIRAVNRLGYLAIVATNQSGVARGLFTEDLVRAAREHDIDLIRSWMIGDSVVDLEAGAAAGAGAARGGAMSRAAVFLDRDGTICEEVGYVNHVSRSRLLPNSLEAIRLLNRAGYFVVVATNQSGVARGLFGEDLVRAVHRQLASWVEDGGGRLDAIYYCPHHPREGQPPYRADCDCRKPKPGMLLRAAREHALDLGRSYMVGDSLVDLEAGTAAGAGVVHVLTGYGRGLVEHHRDKFKAAPLHTAQDLLEAVGYILERDGKARGGVSGAGG